MSEVRIKFVRDVPVDLDSLPQSARGQCLKMSPAAPQPTISGDQLVMPPSPPRVWHFQSGAIVQLPDAIATPYLESGDAETYESHTGLGTFHTVEPEERKAAV